MQSPITLPSSMLSAAEATQLTPADAAASVQRGATEHFVVSFDNSLGTNGETLADAVLATCEADYNKLQEWFGNITIGSLPFHVFIQPGFNGASHSSCTSTGLNCDAFNGMNADLVRSLVVAEADEVFMATRAPDGTAEPATARHSLASLPP